MKKVRLIRSSIHWKDRAAGYHLWGGISTCEICGREYSDQCWGTRSGVESLTGGYCSDECEAVADTTTEYGATA